MSRTTGATPAEDITTLVHNAVQPGTITNRHQKNNSHDLPHTRDTAMCKIPSREIEPSFMADFTVGSIAVLLDHTLIISNKQKLDSPAEILLQYCSKWKLLFLVLKNIYKNFLKQITSNPTSSKSWLPTK